MITLIDGPVAGTYMVKRTPLYLRAVEDSVTGGRDVLDQLEDEPKATEKVFVYKLQGEASRVHLNFGRGKGGYYAMGEYKYLEDGQAFRETEAWRRYCISHTEGKVNLQTGVIEGGE